VRQFALLPESVLLLANPLHGGCLACLLFGVSLRLAGGTQTGHQAAPQRQIGPALRTLRHCNFTSDCRAECLAIRKSSVIQRSPQPVVKRPVGLMRTGYAYDLFVRIQ
jgi:hypothetical protein